MKTFQNIRFREIVGKKICRIIKNYAKLKKVQPKFSPGWDEINGKIISTWNLGETETAVTEPEAAANCFMNVEEGATIVFSGWGDETEQQIYRDSIERFAEVCPGVTVDYQPIPADFQTKLKASMAGGTAADVFYVDDQLMTAFAPTGQLLPLDDYLAQAGASRSDFIPALLSIFTREGVTNALPKDWGTLGLVYLPAAFEAAGIDEPTADWGWDDLKTAAAAIAATDEFGGPIPVGAHARIDGEEIGQEILRLIGSSPAFLMKNHGVFTIGKTPEAAVKTAVMVEDVARTVFYALQLGQLDEIPKDEVARAHLRYLKEYGQ